MDCNKINQAGWGKGSQSMHELQGDYAGNVDWMGKGKGGYKGKGGFKGYGDKGGKGGGKSNYDSQGNTIFHGDCFNCGEHGHSSKIGRASCRERV